MSGKINQAASLVKGVIFGWLVGTTVGLIAAPLSGSETRTRLREKSDDVKIEAALRMEDARLRAEEMARAGINQATEVKQQGKAVLNEQKIAVQSSVEGLKEGVRTFVEAESGPDTEIQVAPPNSLSNNPETPGNELLDTLTDL